MKIKKPAEIVFEKRQSLSGKKEEALWWQPSLVLFSKLSGWIAGPVIIAVFLGKWLDKKYGTDPWLFLLTVGVAFFFSTLGIVRDSLKEMARIEKEEIAKKNSLKEDEKNNKE